MKSVHGPTFGGPSKSPRFFRERANKTPGPGTYHVNLGIGDRSQFNISSIRSPPVSTFYHSDRRIFEINKDATSNDLFLFTMIIEFPGPGNYLAPSDFGIYESKHRVVEGDGDN